MRGLIEWLEELNRKDTRVRAVLRRSLSFDPGAYPPAYPYVEWSLSDKDNEWRRGVQYLVAGLWAQHWREGRGDGMPIGKACAILLANGSQSTEQRFISLLDADRDQLPYRLRQIVSLLKEYPLDFEALREGLLYWNDDRKRTQNRWARDFYRTLRDETDSEEKLTEEIAQ